jgi:hypothetical protein
MILEEETAALIFSLLIPASYFCNLTFSFLFLTLHFSGAPSRAPLTSIIRAEQKKKRNLARLRGEIAPWTDPIRDKLYKNTREGRREEYRNRPIVPCAVPSIGPVIIGPSAEQREINFRRVLDRFAATDPFQDDISRRRLREPNSTD